MKRKQLVQLEAKVIVRLDSGAKVATMRLPLFKAMSDARRINRRSKRLGLRSIARVIVEPR